MLRPRVYTRLVLGRVQLVSTIRWFEHLPVLVHVELEVCRAKPARLRHTPTMLQGDRLRLFFPCVIQHARSVAKKENNGLVFPNRTSAEPEKIP